MTLRELIAEAVSIRRGTTLTTKLVRLGWRLEHRFAAARRRWI